MTGREFDNYVKSFNKAPKEFTKEEILEIGKVHRTLDRKDRNWNKLAQAVGYASGDNLRCFVKSRLAKEGLFDNDSLLTKLEKDALEGKEINTQETFDEIDRKMALLYKEQVKYNDARASYKRTLRDEARIEVMLDAIKNTVDELRELPEVKITHSPYIANSEAVLLLSDLHIGVVCNNFYNKYDKQIASERLSKLVTNVIDYCRTNKVQRLNVLNLGDAIHGIIHTNARVEQELDVISQVMVASELISQALNTLQNAAPEVIYRSVVDNHSRVVPDYSQHIEKENFSRLIDWFLQERLKNTRIIFANDNIDDGIGKFELLNGKHLVFAHGHQGNKSTSVQDMVGALREYVDYVCLGHYHNVGIHSFQGSKVFINGSIVGTEQYALSKRLFSEPEQTLLIFDGANVSSIIINLK